MRDLRLIGVHEDGDHLLLGDAEGGRYRLTLDEALRAAARRDRPRLGQLQIEIEGGMRPREVQALIRRGMSAEEVAERAGWTVEKVRRFEGPILAEREHVARKARECAVGSRGDAPLTLEERVLERLRDRGVDRDAVEWDSARDAEGVWQLSMTFAAGGRRRTATWRYEPLGGSVAPADDEARWLSEESTSGLIPAPHRAPTPTDLDVYDIDADGGLEQPGPRRREPHEPIDLMAAMREHSTRGRRSRRRPSPAHTPGDDGPREDALPLEALAVDPASAGPPPASRSRKPVADHVGSSPDGAAGGPDGADEVVGGWPEDDEQPAASGPDRATARVDDPADDPTSVPAPAGRPADESADEDSADEVAASRSRAAGRKGRPSVPSWDDIVFGTKGSGPA
ncbi:septation protein SepH [Phycicoccus flavus]|uniref:DUF3071 domain-containing protein n=1 Tax=Phycicoccus flavus TaxID=2502783 RepID=A0A8T6RBR0_9MICO|nr:septation protein SepH [Phycicoccus flavus]NHA69591.1 DUF3071 domain-containing protein [Phycicoccus flavus]